MGTNSAAIGETLLLQMSLHYFPIDPITQGLVAAFEGGTMAIRIHTHSPANVTPPGGVPLLGGNGTSGCGGVQAVTSQPLRYTVNTNDISNGTVSVFAVYTNGMAHIGQTDLAGIVSGTRGLAIPVDGRPYIQFAVEGNTLTLSWSLDTNSLLEEARSLGDAWTATASQQNPQQIVPGISNRFYRIIRH